MMEMEFSIEQIQALLEGVHKNQISELLLENDSFRLRIRGEQAAAAEAPALTPAPAAAAAVQVSAQVAAAAPVQEPAAPVRCITSPIVGTFYAASSPDTEPFVKVGQTVAAGETVFIVESMKVMNEVPADQSGVIAEILVKDGEPVEYGQPVLRLE